VRQDLQAKACRHFLERGINAEREAMASLGQCTRRELGGGRSCPTIGCTYTSWHGGGRERPGTYDVRGLATQLPGEWVTLKPRCRLQRVPTASLRDPKEIAMPSALAVSCPYRF